MSMDVKLNSKIHLQQTSSGVFEPFRATLAFKICKKCYYEQKKSFAKICFWYKKTLNSVLISKTLLTFHAKKVIGEKVMGNEVFRHFFTVRRSFRPVTCLGDHIYKLLCY
jgi:hypothetical protein